MLVHVFGTRIPDCLAGLSSVAVFRVVCESFPVVETLAEEPVLTTLFSLQYSLKWCAAPRERRLLDFAASAWFVIVMTPDERIFFACVLACLLACVAGVGSSISKCATVCQGSFQKEDLKTHLPAHGLSASLRCASHSCAFADAGTNIEGEMDAVLAAVKRCQEVNIVRLVCSEKQQSCVLTTSC